MKAYFLTVAFLLIFHSINSIHLSKTLLIDQTTTNEAINRIMERIDSLSNDTSCKVASKFMLFALGNIKDKSEMSKYTPTNDLASDLSAIRKLLIDGYMLHIEIQTNHHFIVFLKDERQLYLLHAFQDRWRLIDWISHRKVTDTYLTIDDFIQYMSIMLNEKSDRAEVDRAIINLFMPPFFNTNPNDIKSLLQYFGKGVKLINVNYVPFDFSIKNKGKRFNTLIDKVIKNYSISIKAKKKKKKSKDI